MTDDEYRDFLTYVFERYVRPRLSRVRRRFHHHMMEEWDYHLEQAKSAGQILRFIENYCDGEGQDDPYHTFTSERLARTVSDARNGLNFSVRVSDEGGFLDVLESHMREILADLRPNHLPEVDKEVLRDMGSPNPDVELRVLILQVKAWRERHEQSRNEVSIRQQLEHLNQILEEAERHFRERI